MSVDKTDRLHSLFTYVLIDLTRNSRAHRKSQLVRVQDLVPKTFKIVHIVMDVELMGAAGQRVHGLTSRACLNTLITAEDLGPHFLEDEHPDLIHAFFLGGAGEGPPVSSCIVGEVVVDDHRSRLSVDVDSHGVAPGIVDVVRQEDLLDAIGVLGERSEC